MMRECSNCHRLFTPGDLAKRESKGMAADRRALGLEGMRFLYYTCSHCGYADIFVDLHPLGEESADEFRQRRAALESAVRELHAEHVGVVVTTR